MSNTISLSPSTKNAIEQAKQHTLACKGRFQLTFSFVPDDKLDYSPSSTTRTPLRIATHVAMSNFTFAGIIKMDPPKESDMEAIKAMMAEKEASITTREQALAMLEESTDAVLAALDGCNDDTIDAMIPTPVFTAPMTFWMNLPARHMDNHASQIDYIQTVWGDMDWHMG